MNKDRVESLVEREQLASLSTDVGTALVKSHNLIETLQSCCEAIIRNLDAAYARIWTLDKETNHLSLQVSVSAQTLNINDDNHALDSKFDVEHIAKDRQPHLTNDIIGDLRLRDLDWAKREGIIAFAGYPLVVEDELVGIITLFSGKQFTQAIFEALAVIAGGIALAIERYEVETRLKEQTEVVETINRIGHLLSAELDQQKLVQAVTDAATELTGAEFGSFFYNVYDDQGGSYMLYTLSGVPHEKFSNFPMPRATALFGPTFRGEGTIRVSNVKQDPRYGHSEPYHGMPQGHLPVVSYLAVPVIARSGEVLGGLFFGHSNEGIFTARHERIVEGLAAQAAIAMDNARLYRAAQNAVKERSELLEREQKARAQAEVASRAKDEFLGLLSHELRTPLNAILGWTRMLSTGELDSETYKHAIQTIDRNARLQSHLIEDMLDLSRIISGKMRLDAQPVDLTTVINAAVDTSRPAADAKEIRIQVVLDFGAGLVLGDPVRLQQVVWNLLSNAIKFTPKHGKVQVQLERINSHLEISVSDTGTGIDEDFLPFIFDRFRQADSTSSKKHAGLGLGLSIVHYIVELHGGTIEACNRTDMQGAIFCIKLPLMVMRSAGKASLNESDRFSNVNETLSFGSPNALEGIKILSVDDEADTRFLLETMLKQCGAEVKTCENVAEAIRCIEEFNPDILISDIGMPDEDGYSLIKKVRALDDKVSRIPAVALTGYARVEDRLNALSAGYNMHVPKPIEPTELIVVIASLTAQNKS